MYQHRFSLLERIYRLKLIAIGLGLIMAGLLISAAADWLTQSHTSHLLVACISALSDVLVVTGGFGIAIDFFSARDREAADIERTRAVLKELTPDFTDAVLKGFAVEPDDLERVAKPELLDDIATNVLALRLGDRQFAEEIYSDLRDQAIGVPERWYDVEVSIRLSSADERDTRGVPLFAVTIQWEYTVTPRHSVQRFACTSDREEFNELITDMPATSTWFMTPRPGFDAHKRESFELLEYSVEAQERAIRRTERRTGQTYSVTIGEDIVRAAQPVRIKHTYRTIVAPESHRLFVELTQPTRDFSLQLDYTDTPISRLSVADLVTSSHRPQISELPTEATGRVLSVEVPGWLLPKAGLTFVWTVASEEPTGGRPRPSTVRQAARRTSPRSAA